MKALFLLMLFPLVCLMSNSSHGADPFEDLRNEMVERQIKARGVQDPAVLKAMTKVPRHEFVPAHLHGKAYEDHPLPIGEGQTISQPYIVALMTELLALPSGARVLEVGTGSGYQAAVLGEIADEVYSIEIISKLAKRAEVALKRLGYSNIQVREGDGYLGWPEAAPFDGIMVTAAPEVVPQLLLDQLKEGGRLVIPVGPQFGQSLYVFEKVRGEIRKREVIPVSFVRMVGLVDQ